MCSQPRRAKASEPESVSEYCLYDVWSACAGKVMSDVQMVWANCRRYNAQEAPIVALCNQAQTRFKARWVGAGLPSFDQDMVSGGGRAAGGKEAITFPGAPRQPALVCCTIC